MLAPDLLALLDAVEEHGITYWVDGGWGVDCLLGTQTREHSDVDLVLPRPELPSAVALLTQRGFDVIRDWQPTTLALRDAAGREVDLHLVDPTSDGGGDQALDDGSKWHYGPPVMGSLDGRPVPCAPADEQVAMRQGYEPREVDRVDLRRLAERFGLAPPEPFA